MTAREDTIERIGRCLEMTSEKSISVTIPRLSAELAVSMLKEQEAVEPLFNERMKHFVCPNCSLVLDEGRDNYCPSCGKQIAWTEYYIHEDETESR